MRFLHLSDLHLGKAVHECSMLEDQRHILRQIEEIVDKQGVDAVVIAGDVYDRSVPPAEAVELLDGFLTRMVQARVDVLLISGNHDSPERVGFLGGVLDGQGIYIESVFSGRARRVTLTDALGPVHFYLLPYVKPAKAAPFFTQAVDSYEDAVRLSLAASKIDAQARNVLVAHQLFTGTGTETLRCESESVSIGGVENVDISCVQGFDYVALGHLHRAQRVGRETVRYAGSPLKYSFSEAMGDKSVTLVEIREKDDVRMERIPLVPLRDLREIRGPIDALIQAAGEGADDYLRVVLTDAGEVYDALARLRRVYPNVLRLDFERARQEEESVPMLEGAQTPEALFERFYAFTRMQALTQRQQEIVQAAVEAAREGEEAL
jgi:exonuclease SbcD